LKRSFIAFTVIVLLFTAACKEKVSSGFKSVNPVIYDGINIFNLNTTADESRFTGRWSAPRLKKGKFQRVLSGNGEIFFFVTRLEKYLVYVEFAQNRYRCSLRINNSSKSHAAEKKTLTFTVSPDDLLPGKNSLNFLMDQDEKIAVKRILIYPKSTGRVINRENLFSPCTLTYYLNPEISEKLAVKLDWNGKNNLQVTVKIRSEKAVRSFKKQIKKGQLNFIYPIDKSICRIEIFIPSKRRKRLSLLESRVYGKVRRPADLSLIKKGFKDKNVLFILIDAARANRLGSYGYRRDTTPNIDRLSKGSFMFRDFYSEAAYTLASTGTLMTGLPPDYHGVINPLRNGLAQNVKTLAEAFSEKGYFTAAVSSNPNFGRAFKYDQGFKEFVELFEGRDLVMAEDFIAPFRKIISGIGDKKFFIYLHLREPHIYYDMPPPFLGKFQQRFNIQSEKLKKEEKRILFGKNNSREDVALVSDLYDENLAYADSVVGRLIDVLKEKGQFKNTVTVILSDHGEALGEHGLIGHNVVLYREGLHIPLIVRVPGLEHLGREFSRKSLTSDLIVTLYDFFDLKFPYGNRSFGTNLFDLPERRNRLARSVMFKKYSSYMVESYPFRMIYTRGLDGISIKIFDSENDPYEITDISSRTLVRKLLLFILRDFILNVQKKNRTAARKSELRKKDIESLKSLGYID
jgi:arylsulfatase